MFDVDEAKATITMKEQQEQRGNGRFGWNFQEIRPTFLHFLFNCECPSLTNLINIINLINLINNQHTLAVR
jgi:hypothetical protein